MSDHQRMLTGTMMYVIQLKQLSKSLKHLVLLIQEFSKTEIHTVYSRI